MAAVDHETVGAARWLLAGSLRTPTLRAAQSGEEYALHVAATEWTLHAPILIRDINDAVSKAEWKVQPFEHQVRNLQTFGRIAPAVLIADDVGLGKTISAGLILCEYMLRSYVRRALIVAPKLIVPQWVEELKSKFGLIAVAAAGSELEDALRRPNAVVVTTYESMRRRLPTLPRDMFQMVIFDEAHKLRNLHGTAQPPAVAKAVRDALSRDLFPYILMLTATPIQNRVWDLYSLIDLLAIARKHVNPLGTPAAFKAAYIEDPKGVKLRVTKKAEFRRHIGRYIVRQRRGDVKLQFPKRDVVTHRVKGSDLDARLLTAVKQLMRTHPVNGLTASSIGQALMSSPAAIETQVRNMTRNGSLPNEWDSEIAGVLQACRGQPAKLGALGTLVADLARERPNDWRLVVFTSRRETQRTIGQFLQASGCAVGFVNGDSASANQATLDKFRENPPRVRVVVSTDSGAEGVNLQVANVLVNYDLPWNPMILEQRIGRIQRLASSHSSVKVLNFVLTGTVEELVVDRLASKLLVIADSIGEVESILESGGLADGAGSFETKIRQLVIDSLKGADVAHAVALAEASIERGKQIYEEEIKNVEDAVGDVREHQKDWPRVPDITPVVPSVDSRNFVERAFRCEGATLTPVSEGVFSVSQRGRSPFRIAFSTGVRTDDDDMAAFGGNAPRIYAPHHMYFERLASEWSGRSAALVVDRASGAEDGVDGLLSRWIDGREGVRCIGWRLERREVGLDAELACKASVSVEHDRLEKLVAFRTRTGPSVELRPVSVEEPMIQLDAQPATYRADFAAADAAVRSDPDLCKFVEFYRARLANELSAAGSGAQRENLKERFTPRAAAEIVSVRGVEFAELHVVAEIVIDGTCVIESAFVVVPGAVDEVRPVAAWHRCEGSGRELPLEAMERCAVTGKTVSRTLMERSKFSGRWALAGVMISCEASGDLVLPEEVGLCEVSGKRVVSALLRASAISGRSAMVDQMATCSFTGVALLPEEREISEVSGQGFRNDQGRRSVLSGRRGHSSEFVEGEAPKGLLARDEAVVSDVSGAWGAPAEMVRSTLPPHRLGLPSERVECAVSGLGLLVDEAARCAVTQRRAIPGVLGECEFTRSLVLPTELDRSDISGKMFRRDQAMTSALCGRKGHADEFVRSVLPTGFIPRESAEQSAMTGEWGAATGFVASERPPNRRGLPGDFVTCHVSKRRLMRDETGISEVSGIVVDDSLLLRSALSERRAVAEEMVTCDATGARVLGDEADLCRITRKLVDKRELVASDISGRLGRRGMMVRCAVGGRLLLPDETQRCEVSSRLAETGALRHCVITGRRALPTLVKECPTSKKVYIDDEVSGKKMLASAGATELLAECEWTGRLMLRPIRKLCVLSGLRVDPRELNARGEMACLRKMFDGNVVAGAESADIRGISAVLGLPFPRVGTGEFWMLRAPAGGRMAIFLQVAAGVFGFGVQHAGLLIDGYGPGAACKGVLVGIRRSAGWVAEPLTEQVARRLRKMLPDALAGGWSVD